MIGLILMRDQFTEVNPDKGTETIHLVKYAVVVVRGLQKLTPIRGRKQS